MYIMLINPTTLQPKRVDIVISAVYDDGSFDVTSGAVQGRLSCPVYDDAGSVINPASLSPPMSETALLKAQVQALTERGEFLEDVIAELAMMTL